MCKRFFSCFIALILVCSLMLHAMTPRAKAFDLAGAVLYNIAGNIGVNAALRAIGVGPGNSPEAFNNLVNNIANSDIVNTAGQILVAGTTGDYKGFFQKTFLQGILDFMFDTGVLVSKNVSLAAPAYTKNMPYSEAYSYASLQPYSLIVPLSDGGQYLFASSVPFSFNDTTITGAVIVTASKAFWTWNSNTLNWTSSRSITVSDYASYSYIGSDGLTTTSDLLLDSVASSVDSSLYDSWTANGGTYDGGDYIPVSIPSLDASAISAQTQAQAQTGSIPDAVVEEIVAGSEAVPDTDTGTIAGVIEAIQALPQTLADNFTGVKEAVLSIPQAIADVFTPAQDITFYQLDLKSLFPFCIPFDVYSMLAALAADPVAPSFDFELDLGPVGLLPISADFSDWDDAAAFLRTCETLVFAVALAVKTKDLIGW